MRSSLAFVLVTTLAGCGGFSGNTSDPDASGPTGDGGLQPPARGFQIISPTVDIDPGADLTYCYYFRTPNTSDLAIKKWASHMTPGGHHMIVYLTPGKLADPGTLQTDTCGFELNGIGPVWTYSAQSADHESALPSDDGNGVPVGQLITASHYGFIQMHYLNATDAVIHAHIELNAYAYDEGVQVTQAAPFITYNRRIDLAPGSTIAPTPGMVNGTCNVPLDNNQMPPKFYIMSTHTHKQGVHTFIKDGGTTVFDSTNWEHPGERTWSTAPFFSFTSGQLTYQCEYMNPNNYRIQTGDSTATAEVCMAFGYYFPAADATGHYCLNSAMLY